MRGWATLCFACLLSCAVHPSAPLVADDSVQVVPAAPADPAPATSLRGLRLIARFPEELQFAPMGPDAVLIVGEGRGSVPMLISGNQLRYSPALLRFSPGYSFGAITGAAGQWPHNAWLAVSFSSDTGWSGTSFYRWVPPVEGAQPALHNGEHWEEYYQHDSATAEVVTWRGNVVALDPAHFAVMFEANAVELSATGAQIKAEAHASSLNRCSPPHIYSPLVLP